MTDASPPPSEEPQEEAPQLPAEGASDLHRSRDEPGAGVSSRAQSRQFAFDGGAATYVGTGVLAFLITVLTLGICYPFALVLRERWRAKHSFIDGRQLMFTCRALGLFGMWLKWLVLIIVTLGIYLFWVGPRLYRWRWENTSWAVQPPAGLDVRVAEITKQSP